MSSQPTTPTKRSYNETVEGSPSGVEHSPRAKRPRRSGIYTLFKDPETIIWKGRTAEFFACSSKNCRWDEAGVHRYLDKNDNSTTRLKNHAVRCWGSTVVANAMRDGIQPPETMALSTDSSTRLSDRLVRQRSYTNQERLDRIVRWVSESSRPPQVVSDPGFLDLMKVGRPNLWIPSPSAVSSATQNLFEATRQRVKSLVKNHPGKLSFITNTWISPDYRSFVAIIVSLDHQGNQLELLLDFIELPENYTPDDLATAFANTLVSYEIDSKILAVTTDNTSTADLQVAKLGELLTPFDPTNRIRYFDHVLHITARMLLLPLKTENSDTAGYAGNEEIGKVAPVAGDTDLDGKVVFDQTWVRSWNEAMIQSVAEQVQESRAGAEPLRNALTKIRKLSNVLINSPTKLDSRWRDILDRSQIPYRPIPRDVQTRWTSTLELINFVIKHLREINELTNEPVLESYTLDRTEWDLLKQLQRVLQMLKDAALLFSKWSGNIASVLAILDVLEVELSPKRLNYNWLSKSVQVSMELAHSYFTKNYSRESLNMTSKLAIALHPTHKFNFFGICHWPADSIFDIKVALHAEFNERSRISASLDKSDEPNEAKSIFSRLLAPLCEGARPEDELDRYLSQPSVLRENPIKWWWEHRTEYPILYRMALDHLCIPATSTSMERVLNQAHLLLSGTRDRQASETVKAILCMGSWHRAELVNRDGK